MENQRVESGPECTAVNGAPPQPADIPRTLNPSQLHALFDILTHQETYAEVESFKEPGTIAEYGYPFARHTPESKGAPSHAADSSAPLLAGVLRSIVLPFPGVRDLPAEFWQLRFQDILEKLAEAGLSESYDKGALGTRKTLATAASAIHEAVSRGILGGVERTQTRNLHGEYDRTNARDLVRAWEEAVQELVYGNLVEELFTCAAEKQSLEEHSPGVQAAADYIILHLAALIHHVVVLSPEGPYLLKLLENVNRLLPYSMVKQTLRIGNAATMLNGMMRLLLAKMGVGAISNWVGLTQNADDGMNLLQRIIWMVLSWDALEFRKSADAIEKTKGGSGPSKEQLAAIRNHVAKPKSDHDQTRKESLQNGKSIVVTILERSNPSQLSSLTETQHAQCLEYLSALLAARDRDEIISSLCRQSPDLFTQAIKDGVASFEPMIRAIHQHVDLREHASAAEGFIAEFIKVSKVDKSTSGTPKGGASDVRAPSVENYVLLLRNNRQLVYNWLHQVASQCPEIRKDFCAWAKETIKVFQQPTQPSAGAESPKSTEPHHRSGAAGALSPHFQSLFASLPSSTQTRILPAIDAHAEYLSHLEALSLTRLQRILDNLPTTTTSTTTSTTKPTSTTPAPPTQPQPSYFSPAYWSGRSAPRSPTPNPPLSTAFPSDLASGIASAQGEAEAQKKSFSGPGMYLARWQQLLDDTVIGPATPGGPFRRGRDVKGVVARGKTGSGAKGGSSSGSGGWDSAVLLRRKLEEEEEGGVRAVDVSVVVEALGEGFRRLVKGFVPGLDGDGGGGKG